jgi:hypothetical protein
MPGINDGCFGVRAQNIDSVQSTVCCSPGFAASSRTSTPIPEQYLCAGATRWVTQSPPRPYRISENLQNLEYPSYRRLASV